jgi:hypothetical protein
MQKRIGWRDRFKSTKFFKQCLVWMVTKSQALMASLLLFFRSCWAIVKDDLLLEFYNFHEHGIFEKSLNATFVAFIPEKTRQLEVGDFKAISMVGSVYKIMVKVLASRLKHVLGAVILNNHNPFIGW